MSLSDFIIEDGVLKKYIGSGGVVEIPSCVTCIGERAFYNNFITSVVIPQNVKHIGTEAFFNCRNITKVTVYGKYVTMGDFAFSRCTSLTDLTLFCDVGRSAFADCESLKNVNLCGTTVIGGNAFRGCKNLTEISIPNTVTSIYDTAFMDCLRLERIRIPSSVRTLGYFTFTNCYNLENIYFDTCFKDCIVKVGDFRWGDATGCSRVYHFKDGYYVISRLERKFHAN